MTLKSYPEVVADLSDPPMFTAHLTLGETGRAVADEVLILVTTAETLTITSQAEYEAANALFQQVAKLRKRNEAARLERTRPLDAAKATLMDLFRPATEALANGEKVLKVAIREYEMARETERILEQRRLQQAAEAEAAAQRNLLAEAAAMAEAQAAEEEDEDLAVSMWLASERDREAAEKVVARTDIAQASPGFTPVAGTAHRTYWKFRIDFPDDLPREFLMPDERAIRDRVSRDKGNTNIPGVFVWDDVTVFANGKG